MASFQAKIGWKTPRKRENKNCHSVSFRSYPTRNRKFQKNNKKIQKIKKYHYGFIFKPKLVGKCRESENIKSIVPFCSNPTRNRKFQNNSKKIQKTKQYHYGFISSQNWLENTEKERK